MGKARRGMKKIVRAVKKVFRRRAGKAAAPKKIPASRHGIAASNIDKDAAEALARLQKEGYETYIVGGAVRDLLLGAPPKDFDLSTSAMPEEIKKIFRRARIIGRRFRIVHLPIYHRGGARKIIEITTFRADGDEVVHDSDGRILTDNSFGDAAQDARRRDFSCNSLFYNPADGRIIDHTGGYEDIQRKRLAVIGDPAVRFRQDPVRMLRALRFECKLGLTADQSVRRAIRANAELLAGISLSRLFDEAAKIIQSGCAADIFRRCAECGAADYLLPAAAADPFAAAVLADADRRTAAGKNISLSFVLAGIFWPPVARRWEELRKKGAPPVRAMEAACNAAEFADNPTVPRRLIARVMDLYFLQARFEARMTLRRASGILRHELFARAVAFAALRQDGNAAKTARWWEEYQDAGSDKRKTMLKQTAPRA